MIIYLFMALIKLFLTTPQRFLPHLVYMYALNFLNLIDSLKKQLKSLQSCTILYTKPKFDEIGCGPVGGFCSAHCEVKGKKISISVSFSMGVGKLPGPLLSVGNLQVIGLVGKLTA